MRGLSDILSAHERDPNLFEWPVWIELCFWLRELRWLRGERMRDVIIGKQWQLWEVRQRLSEQPDVSIGFVRLRHGRQRRVWDLLPLLR